MTLEDEASRHFDRRTALVAGIASASLFSGTSAHAQPAAGGSAEARLRQLGIELPKVGTPVANYIPAARLGNIVFLAGTGPMNPDGTRPQGKVGRDVTVEQAYEHAKLVGLGLLAAAKAAAGDLSKVEVLKVLGMVNGVPEFTEHPKVINGCSDLFVAVLGERGRHARSAVGMGSLPGNISVEIEVVMRIHE